MDDKDIERRPVPDDIHDIYCEYAACIEARNDMMKIGLLRFCKAKKFATDAAKAKYKFWRKLIKIFPEIPVSSLSNVKYDAIKQEIYWKK